ncbi:hypothetical protein [Thermacetogenium phaeum]|nr:hypothetical protein [Thermacetogenium phaeum]
MNQLEGALAADPVSPGNGRDPRMPGDLKFLRSLQDKGCWLWN